MDKEDILPGIAGNDAREKPVRYQRGHIIARRGRGRLPPHGSRLQARQRFGNIPFLVFIYAGRGAWKRASQRLGAAADSEALIWPGTSPPSEYGWPVERCRCCIEWDIGPSEDQIDDLARALIESGAVFVVAVPKFVDPGAPIWAYDQSQALGMRWVRLRPSTTVYSLDWGIGHAI